MNKKDRARGLMAQSLYEPLAPEDQQLLDDALSSNPDLQQELDDLRCMVDAIEPESVTLDVDLVGSVRARIDAPSPRRSPQAIHYMLAAAAFLIVASGVVYTIAVQAPVAHAPEIAQAPASGLPAAMAAAEALMASRTYPDAYVTLARALEGDPESVRAGEALQLMADMAFAELRWYPEAYENYNALRSRHGEIFQASSENVVRLNVLDEARGPNDTYDPLHALDAARRAGEFEDLEGVVAQYPATYVASLAATDMAVLLARSESVDAGAGSPRIVAMELAYNRCTNPIARGQLKVEIGHLFYRDMNDADRARALYEEVVDSEYTVLAKLAEESLSRLEARSP